MAGQASFRALISSVTNANPCVVTTQEDHEFDNHDFIRITDLNSAIPSPRGMDPINDQRFRIVVTGDRTFYLQDPITYEDVDSTNFTPYVSGGRCNKIQQKFIYEGDS